MIYQALVEAADRRTLLLVEGGFCRYHRRRDGVVVIREILVLPESRRTGLGRRMIEAVRAKYPRSKILARCPGTNCQARGFYLTLGFKLEELGKTRKGDLLNTWALLPCV